MLGVEIERDMLEARDKSLSVWERRVRVWSQYRQR